MSRGHHANDGTASRILRGLLREHGNGGDLGIALTAVASQEARCLRGEHDETVAKPSYVTYVRGSQVRPGTMYCRFCSRILSAQNRQETP